MVITNQLKNQHLLWRAGFGPLPEDRDELKHHSQISLYQSLVKASSHSPEYLDVADNMFKGLMMGIEDAGKMQKKELSSDEKKAFRKQSQLDIKSLNLAWLNEMINSNAQLREKMALFWHGHFASRNLNIFYQQLLLDIIRRHALENFADLLIEVSKSAAMINFLNNNQNRRDHPNENFAREVMELFTLGRGNYTEHDVKEAARAFTGWGADLPGEFVFRKNEHDEGIKTVLGKTGKFDGDDVLHILIEKPQTALFITRKIYRYFVNESLDETRIGWLANRFFQNGYDISQLLKDIFTAEWFYDAKHIGSRIKSPIELLVGIRRTLPMQIEYPDVQLLIQRLLGQLLFYPPNVAGWPGGTNWIDSSSLMFRLRIPQLMYEADEFQLRPKNDDDQMMGMKDSFDNGLRLKNFGKMSRSQTMAAKIEWEDYIKVFEKVSGESLSAEIAAVLLQQGTHTSTSTMNKYIDSSNRDSLIKTTTIQLMSTPEYQLC